MNDNVPVFTEFPTTFRPIRQILKSNLSQEEKWLDLGKFTATDIDLGYAGKIGYKVRFIYSDF